MRVNFFVFSGHQQNHWNVINLCNWFLLMMFKHAFLWNYLPCNKTWRVFRLVIIFLSIHPLICVVSSVCVPYLTFLGNCWRNLDLRAFMTNWISYGHSIISWIGPEMSVHVFSTFFAALIGRTKAIVELQFLAHLSQRLTRWAYSIPMVRCRRLSSLVIHTFKHEYLWS